MNATISSKLNLLNFIFCISLLRDRRGKFYPNIEVDSFAFLAAEPDY